MGSYVVLGDFGARIIKTKGRKKKNEAKYRKKQSKNKTPLSKMLTLLLKTVSTLSQKYLIHCNECVYFNLFTLVKKKVSKR